MDAVPQRVVVNRVAQGELPVDVGRLILALCEGQDQLDAVPGGSRQPDASPSRSSNRGIAT
jgi:hypothetical protein